MMTVAAIITLRADGVSRVVLKAPLTGNTVGFVLVDGRLAVLAGAALGVGGIRGGKVAAMELTPPTALVWRLLAAEPVTLWAGSELHTIKKYLKRNYHALRFVGA